MTRSFQRNGRAIVIVSVLAVGLLALSSGPLSAQTTPAEQPVHDHMAMMSGSGWSRMWDGVAFATINAQGGLRGNTDVRSQNWIMGMAARPLQSGTLTLSGMLSLEPLTVGRRGYSEIFQLGEAYKGLPVTDRQHPHDLFMELAATWHRPLTTGAGRGGWHVLGWEQQRQYVWQRMAAVARLFRHRIRSRQRQSGFGHRAIDLHERLPGAGARDRFQRVEVNAAGLFCPVTW